MLQKLYADNNDEYKIVFSSYACSYADGYQDVIPMNKKEHPAFVQRLQNDFHVLPEDGLYFINISASQIIRTPLIHNVTKDDRAALALVERAVPYFLQLPYCKQSLPIPEELQSPHIVEFSSGRFTTGLVTPFFQAFSETISTVEGLLFVFSKRTTEELSDNETTGVLFAQFATLADGAIHDFRRVIEDQRRYRPSDKDLVPLKDYRWYETHPAEAKEDEETLLLRAVSG